MHLPLCITAFHHTFEVIVERLIRAFDEARLLGTAQNSLPKMFTYPFSLFVH
jgi:hypothetical protein